MCSAIITKNKPQKGRELLHSLPLFVSVLRSEDLRKLCPNVPLGEHASSFLDPGQHFIADLADLLGGDGIRDRLQVKLPLIVDDRVKVERQPVSQVILQCSLGDVGIPELGIESEDQHKPVFKILGHVVALDEGEAVAALHERSPIHFPIFVGEMPCAIFVITFIGDVEFDLDALLIEDGLGAHSPSELGFLLGVKDPPESRLLVLRPPVVLFFLDCIGDVLLCCHCDTPF